MAPHPTKFTNLFRFFFSVSLADKIQLSSLPTYVSPTHLTLDLLSLTPSFLTAS
jgi:hypothetical protein